MGLLSRGSFLLVLLLFYFNTSVFSQERIEFLHLTVEDGLSQNGVRSISQDGRGFMWFGTRYGLDRYDSRKFEVYKNQEQDGGSISSGVDVYALHKDRKGRLWAGTSKGLNLYLPESNSFKRYLHNDNNLFSLSSNEVKAIGDDLLGNIWVGTTKGLSRLDPKTDKFECFYKTAGLKVGIAGNQVQAIYTDGTGNIWLGTNEGLTEVVYKNGHYNFINRLLNYDITTITSDGTGKLWIGTHGGGFLSLVPTTGSVSHYITTGNGQEGLVSNVVRKILYDGNRKLWIGTLKGLSIYDLTTGKYENYIYDPDNPQSVSQNSIYDIYKDKSGSIWVATFYGGISIYHPNTTPFQIFRYNSKINSISGNVISSIKEDKEHNLWIGTEGEGLDYYDRAKHKFVSYRNSQGLQGTISSNLIKAISIDHEGTVWIASHDGGLDHFDENTATFVHYKPNANNPNDLFSRDVYSLLHDSQGRFWVGTLSNGLFLYDKENQAFNSLSENKQKLQLKDNGITSLFEDSNGNVWVGSSKGLYLLGKNKKSFLQINSSEGLDIGKDNINFVQEDSQKRIWIGTYEKGLILYDSKKRKQLAIYTEKDGLPSNNVVGLLEDDKHVFWISTTNGLSRYDGRSFRNYTTEDGLPAGVFNTNSYLKDNRGKMYFGTYSGLVSFFPEQIKDNNYRPNIFFTALKLFGDQVSIGDKSGLLTKSISTVEKLSLAYNQNVFTIDFALLNYIKADKNSYAYKLEGFDKNWNYVQIPSASYSNLPSGNYTLYVKAANNDGVWTNKPISISIVINPPFWRTWWAYALYLGLFLVTMLLIVRFFIRQEKLKSELYYEHINTEAIKALYQAKVDFFTRISHEIRTPLTLITLPVDNIEENSNDGNLVNRNIKIIKRNTDRLLSLINELLDFRKLESGKESLEFVEIEINDFCAKIHDSFLHVTQEKKIDFEFLPSKKLFSVQVDDNQLEKVLYNLLSNAIKNVHKGGKVILSVKEEDKNFVLQVYDNGVGIAPENLDKIFLNFFQVGNGNKNNKGWGIGLSLVKAIVDQHGGGIDIQSELQTAQKAGYTNFKLVFPKYANKPIRTQNTDYSVATIITQDFQEVTEILNDEKFASLDYTILIVEDNDELRTFIKDSFKYDYKIIEGKNGLEGVEKAQSEIPDMIISDVDMPIMNGFEFAKQIKTNEITSHIPIIMLTAFTTDENRVIGLESGVEIYLTKPFKLKVLKLSISNMITAIHSIRSKYSKQILLMPKKVEIQSLDDKFLEKCMVIIEENLNDQHFNVTVLVDKIGMSRAVLYKKLIALTGLNITDFIKSIRLKRAAQLLKEKKVSIADVAYMVGFNDRKYFSKEFKKQYNVSPTAYVEMN